MNDIGTQSELGLGVLTELVPLLYGYEPDYWPDDWVGAYTMFCELMIYFLQAVNLRKTSIPPSSAYNLGRGQCLAQYE